MARIKVCDICGKPIREHARHEYVIKKRFWELDFFWKKIDMCEECYNSMIDYLFKRNFVPIKKVYTMVVGKED